MRLSVRTGLAAFAAATVALLAIAALFNGVFSRILLDRVDAQLRDRAETAPILAAVAERLARSELSGTVAGTRVLAGGRLTELGRLPDDPLPPGLEPGFTTVSADGERWRLYTIEVADVPQPGDVALVQLASPLGDVEAEARTLRRRATMAGLAAATGAGLLGSLLGSAAVRPMTSLRRDSERLDDTDPLRWRVAERYGSPEVDDVAGALNASLNRLANETERRGAALETARAFASSAAHELRIPLQSALTNLNLAGSDRLDEGERSGAIDAAARSLQRMATSLTALRALAQAELADAAWFEPVDLLDLVDAAVAEEARRDAPGIEIVGEDGQAPVMLWADGVRLAVANVIRNALTHGRPAGGDPPRIRVEVDGPVVVVDDDGSGFPGHDRTRLLERFERGQGAAWETAAPGSGLGLTISSQVAVAHGGAVQLADGPLGGARVVLRFGPPGH